MAKVKGRDQKIASFGSAKVKNEKFPPKADLPRAEKMGNVKRKPEAKVEAVPVQQEARAVGRYLKISPTKVQDWTRLIRRKRIAEAETILKFSGTRGGEVVGEILQSAVANAGPGLDKSTWVVAEARADQGPIFRRRVDPKSRGSRGLITTPSTHLKIVLKSNDKNKKARMGEQR